MNDYSDPPSRDHDDGGTNDPPKAGPATSNIKPAYPVQGNPTTQSVRDNFAAAQAELNTLLPSAPYLPQAGGTMTGRVHLFADPVDPMEPVTKQYSDMRAEQGQETLEGYRPVEPTYGIPPEMVYDKHDAYGTLTCNAGSPVFTFVTTNATNGGAAGGPTAADVGKCCIVFGAATPYEQFAALLCPLVGNIVSVTNAGATATITLDVNAQVSLAAQVRPIAWGTDNTPIFNAINMAAGAAGQGTKIRGAPGAALFTSRTAVPTLGFGTTTFASSHLQGTARGRVKFPFNNGTNKFFRAPQDSSTTFYVMPGPLGVPGFRIQSYCEVDGINFINAFLPNGFLCAGRTLTTGENLAIMRNRYGILVQAGKDKSYQNQGSTAIDLLVHNCSFCWGDICLQGAGTARTYFNHNVFDGNVCWMIADVGDSYGANWCKQQPLTMGGGSGVNKILRNVTALTTDSTTGAAKLAFDGTAIAFNVGDIIYTDGYTDAGLNPQMAGWYTVVPVDGNTVLLYTRNQGTCGGLGPSIATIPAGSAPYTSGARMNLRADGHFGFAYKVLGLYGGGPGGYFSNIVWELSEGALEFRGNTGTNQVMNCNGEGLSTASRGTYSIRLMGTGNCTINSGSALGTEKLIAVEDPGMLPVIAAGQFYRFGDMCQDPALLNYYYNDGWDEFSTGIVPVGTVPATGTPDGNLMWRFVDTTYNTLHGQNGSANHISNYTFQTSSGQPSHKEVSVNGSSAAYPGILFMTDCHLPQAMLDVNDNGRLYIGGTTNLLNAGVLYSSDAAKQNLVIGEGCQTSLAATTYGGARVYSPMKATTGDNRVTMGTVYTVLMGCNFVDFYKTTVVAAYTITLPLVNPFNQRLQLFFSQAVTALNFAVAPIGWTNGTAVAVGASIFLRMNADSLWYVENPGLYVPVSVPTAPTSIAVFRSNTPGPWSVTKNPLAQWIEVELTGSGGGGDCGGLMASGTSAGSGGGGGGGAETNVIRGPAASFPGTTLSGTVAAGGLGGQYGVRAAAPGASTTLSVGLPANAQGSMHAGGAGSAGASGAASGGGGGAGASSAGGNASGATGGAAGSHAGTAGGSGTTGASAVFIHSGGAGSGCSALGVPAAGGSTNRGGSGGGAGCGFGTGGVLANSGTGGSCGWVYNGIGATPGSTSSDNAGIGGNGGGCSLTADGSPGQTGGNGAGGGGGGAAMPGFNPGPGGDGGPGCVTVRMY